MTAVLYWIEETATLSLIIDSKLVLQLTHTAHTLFALLNLSLSSQIVLYHLGIFLRSRARAA